MNNLYDDLPEDEQSEYEGIFKYGDAVLFGFYNGNYTDGLKELTDNNIDPKELMNYIQEQLDEWSITNQEYYSGWFDTLFFMQLAEDYTRHLLKEKD